MNVAIITAGGVGARAQQNVPKQFVKVNDKPILVYTLEAFQNHSSIDEICVVLLEGWKDTILKYVEQYSISKLRYIVPGGFTGHESIYNGLKAIRENHSDDDVVIVHDGNRPMISAEIIDDNLAKQKQYGSAVTAIPCTEVVFVSDNEIESNKSIPRENLHRTQTPHAYRLGDLWEAHVWAKENGFQAPASCSLMEMYGKKTYFSTGSEKNIKITTADDIDIFKALLDAQAIRENE